MVDAGPARWCVLLVGFGLGCQRGPSETRASEPDPEPAAHEQVIPSPRASVMPPSEQVGGRWVSCYANYRPTNAPEREVARLAAACGPENGMIPAGPIMSGDAVDAAEGHRLEAAAGDCFRIFAVADAFVNDLGVEIMNPRGKVIASDRHGDRWPILNPDGPVCVFDPGIHTVRVRALSGKGRYALQVWRLP